ncbi:PhnB protein [Paenibacillus sp. yr247]|uniref:VOC family protein n=1 Tax=Paenibacillus sp. yr247 TaxID=1761880 RepID=UPI000881575E|nr:VOC family protein [Paenibacillus sp. yr247]SDN81290.1 PhnB protein [Paenibacillus sp. yr247]
MSTNTPRSEPFETNIAPWLSVSNAAKALEFYKAAFGAIELYRLEDEDGNLAVAQLSVWGADFWIQDTPGASPESVSRGSVRMIMTVKNPDLVFEQALAAGATEIAPVNEGYGWRVGRILDPFGHHWEIGKQISQ